MGERGTGAASSGLYANPYDGPRRDSAPDGAIGTEHPTSTAERSSDVVVSQLPFVHRMLQCVGTSFLCMLLWINGPFGGGKTQTSHELQRRLPSSVICDPEHVGFGLHRAMLPVLRGDFQDLPAWRQGVYEVLDLALGKYDGTLIAPMTVIEPRYFDDIIGRPRDRGHDVRHFALLAERDTVLRRLRERAFGHVLQLAAGRNAPLRRQSFAVCKLDLCLKRLNGPKFAEHLWTDHLTIPQVADHIAASAGLTLNTNNDGAISGNLRRAWVGIRHIRFD